MKKEDLKIGDKVIIHDDFQVEIKGFKELVGYEMIETDWGDFNIDLIKEKIK